MTQPELIGVGITVAGLLVFVVAGLIAREQASYSDRKRSTAIAAGIAIVGFLFFAVLGIIMGSDLSSVSDQELASAQTAQAAAEKSELESNIIERTRLHILEQSGEISDPDAKEDLENKITDIVARIKVLQDAFNQRTKDAEVARQRALVEGPPQEVPGDETAPSRK